VEGLFTIDKTYAGGISDLLVASSFADESRNFLLAPGEVGQDAADGARRADMLEQLDGANLRIR